MRAAYLVEPRDPRARDYVCWLMCCGMQWGEEYEHGGYFCWRQGSQWVVDDGERPRFFDDAWPAAAYFLVCASKRRAPGA